MTQHFITLVIEAYASGVAKRELRFCALIYKDSKTKGHKALAEYIDKFNNAREWLSLKIEFFG